MKLKIAIGLLMVLAVGCSDQSVRLLDSIIITSEALLPVIPNLSPGDAQAARTYIDAALAITNDLIDNVTAAGIQQAAADFQRLAIPQLSQQVSPKAIALIGAVNDAIQVFLTTYKTAGIRTIDLRYEQALVQQIKQKPPKISAKDKARLKAKIAAVRAKLKK
jgi:hypothetical protein